MQQFQKKITELNNFNQLFFSDNQTVVWNNDEKKCFSPMKNCNSFLLFLK